MNIGKCFKDAWGLFTKDLGPLIVTTIVAAAIIGVAIVIFVGVSIGSIYATGSDGSTGVSGLAAGSVAVGAIAAAIVSIVVGGWEYATLYGMLMGRVRERRAASYGDMTKYFRFVGPMILATLVLGILISIGFMLLIIPALLFITWWLLTLVIMVDRGVGFGEAMSESKALAQRVGYMAFFGTWVVGAVVWGVVNVVLGEIPYVGTSIALLVTPLALAYTVSMYLQARGEGYVIDEALSGVPAESGATVRPPVPGAPPAPPAPTAPPSGGAEPEAARTARGEDAWKAAADPLAKPPAPSLYGTPATQSPAPPAPEPPEAPKAPR